MSDLNTILGVKKKEEKKVESEPYSKDFVSLKDKKALVYDHGLFTEMAAALKNNKNGFGEVYYYTPMNHDTLSSTSQKIGTDFKGLTRIQSFWDYVDKADIIVCFDTYEGDMMTYLRSLGYAVWGGCRAEELELKRWEMRQIQNKVGLPTQQSLKVTSLDDLELYLQGIRNKVKEDMGKPDENASQAILARIRKKYDNFSDKYYFGDKKQVEDEFLDGAKDKYFKVNMRGDIESAYAPDYHGALSKLNALNEKLGHRANAKEIEFIVEECKKGNEPGTDMIQVNGEYLSPTLWGIEHKERGYVGRVLDYEELPDFVQDFNNTLGDLIKEKYSPSASFISFEFIIDKKKNSFLIDPSVRTASPVPSAIFSELYENLPEIVWHGAHGEKIKPKMKKCKYAAGVSFCSDWAKDHEMEVEYDKEIEHRVKFMRAHNHKGIVYALPGETVVCTAIGFGDTIEEAIDEVKDVASKVKGYQLNTNTGGLEGVFEDIHELEDLIGKEF